MMKTGFRAAVVGVLCAAFTGLGAPELIFYAPFDGGADAAVAKGVPRPLEAANLEYAPGKKGQAVRIRSGARQRLEYVLAGNLVQEKGTVAMWIKREWTPANAGAYHGLFSTPFPQDRMGTGALALWFLNGGLRADVSDFGDSFFTKGFAPASGQWEHIVFTWDGTATALGVNGRLVRRGASTSPLVAALRGKVTGDSAFKRRVFNTFFVGSRAGLFPADALIDDFRIYSEPLSAKQVRELFEENATAAERAAAADPDYKTIFARQLENPFEGTPSNASEPALDLEPVETLVFNAATVEQLKKNARFKACGEYGFGELDGAPYIETADAANTRFAVRFNLDEKAPLHLFEIDYPDNRQRTMDIIVQDAQCTKWDGTPGADYTMQVGVLTGGVAPISGKILTHKCVYWTRVADVALCVMAARTNGPAAIARVKVWKIRDGKLPPLAVNAPKPAAGWRRQIAMYFEDPAIAYDFPLPEDGLSLRGMSELIDRTAALMKYAGETMLVYPGAWYGGLIGDAYNPRMHAPDFLSAWYEKFDREGLEFIPTINTWAFPYKGPFVSLTTMSDGSLHDTPINIMSTGKTFWGGGHGSNPEYNIFHPEVQAYFEDMVDTLVAQGAAHPSFKGVCIHHGWHTITTWCHPRSGYNDYAIAAFEKDTGVKVDVVRTEPLRGKLYAEWIQARPDVFDKWIDWRCRALTAFWGRIARKMAARRSDLKLWFNCYPMTVVTHQDFLEPGFAGRMVREAGVDTKMLTAAAPNIVVSPCIVPADYRWRGIGSFPADRREERALKNRDYFRHAESYTFTGDDPFPWVALHDLYWESAIGANETNSLWCAWLKECKWRVTALNPAGRHALAHLVAPLSFKDVLGLSKGGFLIGTYGMEGPLREFAAAFRALPAVKMVEFFREGNVVGRQVDYDGRRYFYLVNTDDHDATFAFDFPRGAVNLVSGEKTVGKRATVVLKPYEMRSYCADH